MILESAPSKASYIVDVRVFDISKDFLHDLLSQVWGLFDAHRSNVVMIVAFGCADNAQVFRLIIKLKCEELHACVKLGKEGVTVPFLQEDTDLW